MPPTKKKVPGAKAAGHLPYKSASAKAADACVQGQGAGMSGMRAFHARGCWRTCGQANVRGVDRSTSPSFPSIWQRRFCGWMVSMG